MSITLYFNRIYSDFIYNGKYNSSIMTLSNVKMT